MPKNTYAYIVLYILAALPCAALAMFFTGAFIGGIAWLFLFGDAPWPQTIESVTHVGISISALAVLLVAAVLGKRRGEQLAKVGFLRQEVRKVRNTLLLAFGIPLVVLLFIVVRAHGGLLPHASDACLERCQAEGYSSASYDLETGECTCPQAGRKP